MVVEIKIVVIIVVGMMCGSGGLYVSEMEQGAGPQVDDRAPVSEMLPVTDYGNYYIEPNTRVASLPDDNIPVPSGGPARQAFSDGTDVANPDIGFMVHWAGTDGARGSGIAYYDVEVRIGDDGEWSIWKTQTTAMGGMYYPETDGMYYFRCRAVDNAGNAEEFPQEPQAQFLVHTFDIRGDAGQFEPEPPYVPWDPVVPYPYRPCPPGLYCAYGEDGQDIE